MGKKIVLTGVTFTDATLPKLATIDPIESDGSLYLVEPGNPVTSWAAGVPTSGSTVANLFGANLTALGGTGEVNPAFVIDGAINNGTKGTIERSTKGGLHGIVSQTNALASGDGSQIEIPAALRVYINANLTHDYYVSVWDRLTRTDTKDCPQYSFIDSSANDGIAIAHPTYWTLGPGGAVATLGDQVIGNTLGGRFGNHAQDGAGTVWANGSAGPMWGAPAGSYANSLLASRNQGFPSYVFYRVYLEDLTVSGRTYAEVDAIDEALYQKEVLTAGGRYYGDTYTDPATIP